MVAEVSFRYPLCTLFSCTCAGVSWVVLVEVDEVVPPLVYVGFVQSEAEAAHLKHFLLVPLGQRNTAVVAERRVGVALVFALKRPPRPAGRDREGFVRREVVGHQARGTDVVLQKT